MKKRISYNFKHNLLGSGIIDSKNFFDDDANDVNLGEDDPFKEDS